MNVLGIIVEQIDWTGKSKSLTMQPDYRLGDLWVAFPTEYDEPRTGPFYFQNPSYERQYNSNAAECRARKIAVENFYQTNGLYTFKTIWHNLPTGIGALTYYALYLPEYAVPTLVNLFDPRNPDKKYKRTVLKDKQKPRYIIYLQCSSKYGIFNFNLECQFKEDREGFAKSNYSDKYQTDLYSSPEDWQYLMTNKDKAKTKKFFSEKKITKLELSHKIALAALIVASIVMLFGNNIWGRLTSRKNIQTISDTTTSIIEVKHDTTLLAMELPYLENVPLIDKGLFIKYYFNDFIFGGANIDTISINARTKSGESLPMSKNKMEIKMDINEEPFVEFEYKGSFYSIEITGHHPTINCTLKQNIKPTLALKKFKNL